ncbi:hypothetical protein [Dietzia sp. 179-F 9C3 NHS]|uniref:hypothetical protein n=1 Tax=Dietzia sp. 179-F 9C3 NHS TaxID=3374295 RepID=UPI003879F1A9
MQVQDKFEQDPLLAPALGWDPDSGVLSGGERALATVVRTLSDHFDRLDGRIQKALVATLAGSAAETAAAEDEAARILARARASTEGDGAR